MNNPIGIIDSGVGGLSIASTLIKNLPSESFIYLGDSQNTPYGAKSEEEIFELSQRMIDFLLSKKIKLLVVACNTITVSCIADLRTKYPKIPIVGIVPVIKTAVKQTKNGKIGILSTERTAKSAYFKNLIGEFVENVEVVNIGTNALVPFIEKLDFEAIDTVLDSIIEPFKTSQIDALALGSTHFPLIKNQIEKHLPEVLILDSSDAVVRQVKRILEHNNLLSNNTNPSYNFYTTGELEILKYFVDKLTNEANIEKIQL